MWLANSDTNIISLTQHRVRKTVCFINLLQSKESLSNEGRLPVFSILLHKNCLSDSFKLKRKAFLLQLGTFDLLNNLAEKHLVGAVETGLTTCYALVWKKEQVNLVCNASAKWMKSCENDEHDTHTHGEMPGYNWQCFYCVFILFFIHICFYCIVVLKNEAIANHRFSRLQFCMVIKTWRHCVRNSINSSKMPNTKNVTYGRAATVF